jgi:hypothetical protein
MPSRYDDDIVDGGVEYLPDESDQEHDEEEESVYSDYEDHPEDHEGLAIRPTTWRHVRILGKDYHVSCKGHVKPSGSLLQASKGFADASTPFRIYTFQSSDHEAKTYYMHDIVWRAFNGEPPEGWQVSHTSAEVSKRKRCYSNALHNLTISPILVEVRPTIFT